MWNETPSAVKKNTVLPLVIWNISQIPWPIEEKNILLN